MTFGENVVERTEIETVAVIAVTLGVDLYVNLALRHAEAELVGLFAAQEVISRVPFRWLA